MNKILTKKELLSAFAKSWEETKAYLATTSPAQQRIDRAKYKRELAERIYQQDLQEARDNLSYLEGLRK